MEGKVVAITGGASGIGLATAKLLASRGARVSICDVCHQEKLNEAATSIREAAFRGDEIMALRCHVRDVLQVSGWLKATVDKFGRLDHVANVAGVIRSSKVEDHDEELWDFVIGVNLTVEPLSFTPWLVRIMHHADWRGWQGTMHVLRESIKLMPDHAGRSIVAVASIAGLQGLPAMAAYCASKHGVIGLARSMAKEVASRGIRVNCVAPGAVDTPGLLDVADGRSARDLVMSFASTIPMARAADAVEIARLIAFLLGDESSFVTGSVYTADGGFSC